MSASKLFRWTYNAFRAVGLILSNPKNLYYVLHNEDVFEKVLGQKFPTFVNGLPQISLADLTNLKEQELRTYSFLGGTSEPIDLILLRILAQKFQSCKYFEIGTWRGESVTNLKDVTSERHSLNLSSDELKARGYSDEEIAAQDFYLKHEENLIQYKLDSRDFDFSRLEKMDLIFIDGDHHRDAVASDTKQVFEHLIHPKSIVVWHDYKQHFSNTWWEVFLGILEGVPQQFQNRLFHVRNTNCAVYLPFDINAKPEQNPWLPELNFEVNVKWKQHD